MKLSLGMIDNGVKRWINVREVFAAMLLSM